MLTGSGRKLNGNNVHQKIKQPKHIFHSLRSDRQNQTLVKRGDMKARPYEKINYISPPHQVLRDSSTDTFTNSIALSVRDQNGDLFDFNGLPLEFELEIS